MIKHKEYFQKDIIDSKIDAHRYLNYMCGTAFLVWGYVDFYNRELFAPIFLMIRIFIFSIMILVVGPLNTKFFSQYHLKFTAVFLTLICISSSLFIILSGHGHQAYSIFIGGVCIAGALLYQGCSKHFLPIILSPFLSLLIFQAYAQSENTEIELLLIKAIFFFFVSFVAHFNIYRFSEKTYSLRVKFEKQKMASQDLIDENNQLVRILCHDLGNALTIIDMTTDLLHQKMIPSAEQEEYFEKNIQRLKRATLTQKEIIEHVRQKEAIESGKQSIEIEPVSLNVVFEKMKFIFQSQIKEKNINFLTIYSTDKSPYVLAELVSLSNNVINNIISNAIKFSLDRGEIIVSTWSDQKFVYVTLEDNGIGMDEKLLANIFSSSAKTSRLGTRGEKGTGFGMPLAKTYMSKYGGEIFVESKVDKGSRFTLKFLNIEQVVESAEVKAAS